MVGFLKERHQRKKVDIPDIPDRPSEVDHDFHGIWTNLHQVKIREATL